MNASMHTRKVRVFNNGNWSMENFEFPASMSDEQLAKFILGDDCDKWYSTEEYKENIYPTLDQQDKG